MKTKLTIGAVCFLLTCSTYSSVSSIAYNSSQYPSAIQSFFALPSYLINDLPAIVAGLFPYDHLYGGYPLSAAVILLVITICYPLLLFGFWYLAIYLPISIRSYFIRFRQIPIFRSLIFALLILASVLTLGSLYNVPAPVNIISPCSSTRNGLEIGLRITSRPCPQS